ncbi:hypothetical protein DPV78_000054 [Talaromyces pinophilus]|nr:hypothetical protein DPV78_000054 [Talaromyces pinophilus]
MSNATLRVTPHTTAKVAQNFCELAFGAAVSRDWKKSELRNDFNAVKVAKNNIFRPELNMPQINKAPKAATQAITKGILISPTPLLGTVVGEEVALVVDAAEVVEAAAVVVLAAVDEGTAAVEEEVANVVEEEEEDEEELELELELEVDEDLVDDEEEEEDEEEAEVEVDDALVVVVVEEEPVTPEMEKRGE